MIHSITANQPSFKAVTFTGGLNVVLADRTDTSSKRDTRNGVGKSTLVEIIHFCLGSNVTPNKGLRSEALREWEFMLEITLLHRRVKVRRATGKSGKVVVEGPTQDWPDVPPSDVFGNTSFTVKEWRTFLGRALFGLKNVPDVKHLPSFRSLISYFVRRGPHAYSDPFSHARQQASWDQQLHLAFLLGLDWRHASEWQELKDREKVLKDVSKAIDSGDLDYGDGTVGELEALRIELEAKKAVGEKSLADFRVHPQYDAIQREANQLTATIHEATNANLVDRRKLTLYEDSQKDEFPPDEHGVETIYEEAGVFFPESVKRTLADARQFYRDVVEDRRKFIGSEVGRLQRAIMERDGTIRDLTEERASQLRILETHGALEEMTALRENHTQTCTELERVRGRIQERKSIDGKRRQLKSDRSHLSLVASHDKEQRKDRWRIPVRLFHDNSTALYKSPGHLSIDVTDSGFKYGIEIRRSDSAGINRMKVFCLDLALLEFSTKQDLPMNFLVHDSDIFDGVDSRQVALAIERAAQVADETGTQYICALNSDSIPRDDFSPDFSFDEHVRLRLTDETADGSLLGVRF